LLKFLDNPKKRLLIADDVGLGKTIEAAYILRELDARQGRLDRVLVVCPARLGPKWKKELRDRFGEHFDIVKGDDLLRQAQRLSQNREIEQMRWIVSYESARKEEVWSALRETQFPFDFVICDEAHRMRNPESLQHKLGAALSECADAMVFLSATPVQTALDNLWYLLRLLSPEEFEVLPLFMQQITANRLLLKTQVALARVPASLDSARDTFQQFLNLQESILSGGVFIESIKQRLNGPEISRKSTVELQADISLLSPLRDILSRTRKSDALPNRPVREAGWRKIELTQEERAIYDSVEELCRLAYRSRPDSWGFQMSLLMAYRITASCIPAAMEYFREKLSETTSQYPAEDEFETEGDALSFGSDPTAWSSPESRTRITEVLQQYAQGLTTDSKLEELIKTLRFVWETDDEKSLPRRKIVVFSYFRKTLTYLERSLRSLAIETSLIHGEIPVDLREEAIDVFLERRDINVLLTSEVGGEGIDLQKACVVVNYDLPWNPMVVEQRIGRVDRIGQASAKIYIFNFIVANSVEEKILGRLLRRIDIFKESVGELDAIIGNQIEEITKRALAGELTGEQLEQVIQLEGDALERRVHEARKVLSEVDGLLAADYALIQEINAVVGERQLPSENELYIYLNKFLMRDYPGCQLPEKVVRDCPEVDLRGPLGIDIEQEPEAGEDALVFARRITTGPVLLTLSRDAAYRHHRAELVHLNHPLCLFSRKQFKQETQTAFSLSLRGGTLTRGRYGFLVALVHVNGYRPTSRLVCIVTGVSGDLLLSDQEKTIPVLVDILDKGEDQVPSELSHVETEGIRVRLLGSLEQLLAEWEAKEQKLNQARAEQQYGSRAAIYQFKVTAAEGRLKSLRANNAKEVAIRLAEGRLNKAIRDYESFRRTPVNTVWGGLEHEEIAVGVLTVHD
jgi:superfamily II DNA or RNA helicase